MRASLRSIGKRLRNEALAAEWQVLREFAQDPFPHELTG